MYIGKSIEVIILIRRISAASSASARSAKQIEAAGTSDWSVAKGGIPLIGLSAQPTGVRTDFRLRRWAY